MQIQRPSLRQCGINVPSGAAGASVNVDRREQRLAESRIRESRNRTATHGSVCRRDGHRDDQW